MIPPFDPITGNLPRGLHKASWSEVLSRFGTNCHRRRLLKGLHSAINNLVQAGCSVILLDGSFVTSKRLPNDHDSVWEPYGVDPDLLDPVLLDFSNGRAAMKAKYGGELFVASFRAQERILFRDFFQFDRNGVVKGIIEIDLGIKP